MQPISVMGADHHPVSLMKAPEEPGAKVRCPRCGGLDAVAWEEPYLGRVVEGERS